MNSQYLWAKLSPSESKWLPLTVHMSDSAAVVTYLWNQWVSESIRNLIQDSIRQSCPDVNPLDFVRFLAASHDIGKASPAFQAKAIANQCTSIVERIIQNGLRIREDVDARTIPHAVTSLAILERNGVNRSVSIIVASHHGSPPSRDLVSRRKLMAYESSTGFDDTSWIGVQNKLLEQACALSNLDLGLICSIKLPTHIQDVLTGLVIISDWLASNEEFFPLIDFNQTSIVDGIARMAAGCARISFPQHKGLVYGSNMTFEKAFGFAPREFQKAAIEMVSEMDGPGLIVIEAPMGEGKTEAALAIAEVLSSKFGQNGLFFGLPTQATANCVFTRVKAWVDKCSGDGTRSITLAHSKSAFNEEYASIPRSGWDVDGCDGSVIVHQWFHGKTGMLSDIVVGTVDQVLMAGLKKKHLFLRHFGLAEKVVIIDECHAYDEYMGSYLLKALNWLGALKVPVIVMSATLPPKRKADMIFAYSNSESNHDGATCGYPMISYVCNSTLRVGVSKASRPDVEVSVCRIVMSDVVQEIENKLTEGGYAGVIVNTVGHAQSLYRLLRELCPDDIILLHSGYTVFDRSLIEENLMKSMIRTDKCSNRRVIVVGTQVLEQSLDIDFDILFTEICPIDLMLQRMGRLHRHKNNRPKHLESPTCFVIDSCDGELDKGSESIYGKYQLMNTRVLLGDKVSIPQDVPVLVRSAYSETGVVVPDDLKDEYASAKMEQESIMERKELKAKVYQISSPSRGGDLTGWLDNERSDPQGQYAEATVRDIDGSVDAILICKDSNGDFYPVGKSSDERMDPTSALMPSVARRLLGCKISLPHRLISKYGLDKVIDAVSMSNRGMIPDIWFESEWLNGELIQIVDEEGRFEVLDMKLRYDHDMGLISE